MHKYQQKIFLLQPLAVAISLIGASGSCAAAPGLFNLDTLSNSIYSEASAISADGTVVAGDYRQTNGRFHIFEWKDGVSTDLQPSEPSDYSATSISYNGNVIVGNGPNTAFRYQGGTFTTLNPFGTDAESFASGVSGDGMTIVGGSCAVNCQTNTAVEWLAGGTTATRLAPLSGQLQSDAQAVNQDGTVVVGSASLVGFERAVYWVNSTVYDLGTLVDSPTQMTTSARANAVSADGKAVAGWSNISAGGLQHATLWKVPTPTTPTAIDLGALVPNSNSIANGISADGKVVIGQADFPANTSTFTAAFRWTQATGMQTIPQWLSGAGVSMPSGWEFSLAMGVNKDGSVVVGQGEFGGKLTAWLARVADPVTPPDGVTGITPGSGLIDIADYNASVAEAGARAVQAGVGLPNLTMFGAHHRSILDSGLARSANGVCAWATADASGDNRSNTFSQITEAGICKDIGTARIGLGVGQAWSQQDLSLNGSARYNGQYLILEAADGFENGLQPSLTAYYGRFDTSMDRHYMNGAAVDSSSARPKAQSYAVRARLDWKDAARLGKFDLSPYTAYTWMRTRLDAYTETGGGFPAQFDASSWSTNDLRIGSAAKTSLPASTDLRLGLEAVHRLDGNTNGVNGQVLGLWSFSVPGQSTKQTWARGTIDIDHRITDSALITVGLNLATPGGDASWGVTAGIRASF